MLDCRTPEDEVIIVRFHGSDIGGAEALQTDGSWRRGSKTEKRFIRPEAERFVAEHAAELKFYTLNLWVVVSHYKPPPDTPERRAERERAYIEAMQRDKNLD